jgi:subtilisin family serine protease
MRCPLIMTVLLGTLVYTAPVVAAKHDKPHRPEVHPPALESRAGHDNTSILVRYQSNTPASVRASAHALVKASLLRESGLVPGLEHIGLAPGMTVERAVKILNKLPSVAYAHPNYRVHVDQVPPDDEHFLEQWALNNTGQTSFVGAFAGGTHDADIDWLEASSLATGAGVVVAVLDTGVDYRHTDIGPNLWLNEAEVNGVPGVDDDGNGYIDDERGWDFANNDPYPLDVHGHGTAVSGIIAAVTHNTKGVAGIMPAGRVMALKTISDNGEGLLSDAIEALEYALDKGVRISNNSWGYTELLPEEVADHNALQDTILAAQAAGHLFVASAGNASNDTDIAPHYPSSFDLDNIVSVGATDNNDLLAWFSSYGLTSVDLSAPGDLVMSTTKLFAGVFEDYTYESGTSLSAPQVSGVAGLILEMQPGWSYAQIKDRLLTTTRPVPALAGKSATGGVVNMHAALSGLPEQIVDIDVRPGDPANQISPNKAGDVPVAVLSSAAFDAAQVDPATLRFGAGQATPIDAPDIADVDGQFGADSTNTYAVAESGIACDDIEVTLTGETYNNQVFSGTDAIDASDCNSGGCHP